MSGILLTFGSTDILNVYFGTNSGAVHNLYLGLMTKTTNPAVGDNVGANIVEMTGTGYARQLLTRASDWTPTVATPPYVTATQKTFTVGAGGWTAVNGYIVCLTGVATTADAVFAEAFPSAQQGDKLAGDTIKVTVNFTEKDTSQ